MIRDVDILKVLIYKGNLDKFLPFINTKSLCRETLLLIDDFKAYYEKYPEHTQVDFKLFGTFFHHLRHPDLKSSDRDLYDKLFENLQSPLNEATDLLIEKYKAQELGKEILDTINANPNPNVYLDIIEKKTLQELKTTDKLKYVTDDLDDILEQTDPDGGYSWRLEELNAMLGRLTPGKFGVIAARPDAGKTGLLASEMSYIVQQLPEDEHIVWMNNEGEGQEIKPRIYTAMLNARRDQIVEHKSSAQAKFDKLGGNRIKILDIHRQSYKFIERVVKQTKPRVVVIDMLDHVRGFDYKQNVTVDYRYEQLYQWARELSCIANCTIIGTSQMNGFAEGVAYPDMSKLKGSQTAKQGAVSWLLMIGTRREAGYEKCRYLSAPKSKYGNKTVRHEVEFDTEKSIFHSGLSPWRYFK